MERNYVTVTACIGTGPHPHEKQYLCIYRLHAHCCFMNKFVWFIYIFCDGFAVTISSVNLLPFRMDSFMFIQKSKYLNLFLICTVTVLGLQFSARIYPIRFWSKEVNHGWLNLVLFICYFRFFLMVVVFYSLLCVCLAVAWSDENSVIMGWISGRVSFWPRFIWLFSC